MRARKKEREEKARLKEEQRANVIYLAPAPPRQPTPLEIKQSAVAYDEASLRLPLIELDPRACRWPVNDPEPVKSTCSAAIRPSSAAAIVRTTRSGGDSAQKLQSIAKSRSAAAIEA